MLHSRMAEHDGNGAADGDDRAGKGSTSVDGKMVDAPVVKRAYALLRSLPPQ